MRCSDCCIFSSASDCPRVFPWERRFLEERACELGLAKPVFEPEIVFLDRGASVYVVLLYRWVIRGRCLFNRDGRCIIHGEHPLACRMYPLIINYSDRTLRVSLQCRWVKENRDHVLSGIDPSKVFSSELKPAVEAFTYISLMMETAYDSGWVEVDPKELGSSREIVDYDLYVSGDR